MSESAESAESAEPLRRPEARFIPDRRLTALAAGGAAGAFLVSFLTTDTAGRLLAVIAGIMLLAYVVTDLIFSPRLIASTEGLVVRSPFARATLRWDEVDDVRADTRFRLGLRSTSLEIDAGPVLAVLTRRALGAEPVEV
ncbi:MAG: PH domain-containing protein, partial [Actinobacteria bacterium]|nr:PH domain-containing protein [Actinomycetota bacterium]